MKVKIEIICEDEKDLMIHLSVIRQQLKKELKNNPEFKGYFDDANCYGWHSVEVSDDE